MDYVMCARGTMYVLYRALVNSVPLKLFLGDVLSTPGLSHVYFCYIFDISHIVFDFIIVIY